MGVIVERKTPDVAEAFVSRSPPQAPDALLAGELPPLDDDQLAMMFLTCHPALPQESRVALTLKIVGGFSVAEIARAFLAQESAIAQRLVRAKRLLRERDVGFGQPSPADLAERLDSVLEAIYLAFNEGYAATAGDVMLREDIAAEAIRLARLVTRHPATAVPEAWALLALLLLHAARFRGRVNSEGELFLLRDQDRSAWDRNAYRRRPRRARSRCRGNRISRYHLEAEIAACHVSASAWKDTDWGRILECYEQLVELTGSPVVMLNRAIARAQVAGPQAAIAELDAIATHPALGSTICCRPFRPRSGAKLAIPGERPSTTARRWRWQLRLPSAGFSRRDWGHSVTEPYNSFFRGIPDQAVSARKRRARDSVHRGVSSASFLAARQPPRS